MSNQLVIQQLQKELPEIVSQNKLVKISLGNYKGNDTELKNLYIRPVVIKRNKMLSFTYRYKTRDIVKNLTIADGIKMVLNFISHDFKICTIFTSDREIIVEENKKANLIHRERLVASTVTPTLSHNKEKKRIVQASQNGYLHDLGITDIEGKVINRSQDKFRQINQYIEILSSLIKELPGGKTINVVDMGSGKGYLTFALYDYLNNILRRKAGVTGVEFREDLVTLCNDIARKSQFDNLSFIQGTIEGYKVEQIDILIALHACDTATDDAIFKGIAANASLIVVAPCCHKQIRREMEKNKTINDVSFLTKYGIFLERQAEMATDALRALILEYCGYKTKVVEFISDVHTPKNVLIVGTKGTVSKERKMEIKKTIVNAKAALGIGTHHLENLLEL